MREYINRRMLVATGSERLALREWHDVLRTTSIARLRRLLVQDDARGRRLRQSIPFVQLGSDQDRNLLSEA